MRWSWPFIAVLAGCGSEAAATETPAADSETPSLVPPEPPAAAESEAAATADPVVESAPGTSVELTFYWVAVRPEGDPDEVRILDCEGHLLTHASNSFRAEVNMERTARARLDSGELVTFNDAGGCYRRINAKQYPWGMGVSKGSEPYALHPFRSIAVDPKRFTFGKWYYAAELDGVMMPAPSKQRHDGCVRAVDEGKAIVGDHVDFFVGDKRAYPSLASITRVTLQESTRCASLHGG